MINIKELWDNTPVDTTTTYEPLEGGVYEAELISKKRHLAKSGTEGVKLEWKVLNGQYAGRRVWQDLWITERSIAFTKRQLYKLQIFDLDGNSPSGIIAAIEVIKRTKDNGQCFNEVKRAEYVRTEQDPFTPTSGFLEEVKDKEAEPSEQAEPAEPAEHVDTDNDDTPWFAITEEDFSEKTVAIVANAIPIGSPITKEEVAHNTAVNIHFVGQAIETLLKQGLKAREFRGGYLYWWQDTRPITAAEFINGIQGGADGA